MNDLREDRENCAAIMFVHVPSDAILNSLYGLLSLYDMAELDAAGPAVAFVVPSNENDRRLSREPMDVW